MAFTITSGSSTQTFDSINETINHLADDLNLMVAEHNHETGLSLSLMILPLDQTLTIDNENGENIKITRTK